MLGKKVLIVDDDNELLQLVSMIFKKSGAQVVTANDGLDGVSKFFTHHPDLIILDVMMPGHNGFQEQEMLQGLEVGADDFLSKPFNPDILLARARTVLRRTQGTNGEAASFNYNDGYLSIDIDKHEVLIHHKRVKLTPIEFRLLAYLARNGGKLLTFEKILANVWGDEYQGNLDHVHVYISHLRRKIEQDMKNPRYILTIHGLGYIFEKQELGYKT